MHNIAAAGNNRSAFQSSIFISIFRMPASFFHGKIITFNVYHWIPSKKNTQRGEKSALGRCVFLGSNSGVADPPIINQQIISPSIISPLPIPIRKKICPDLVLRFLVGIRRHFRFYIGPDVYVPTLLNALPHLSPMPDKRPPQVPKSRSK